MITDIEYFVKRIKQVDVCWQWTAGISEKGYGRFARKMSDGKRTRAHRFSYKYHIAEIPEGLTLDHLCRNKWCVNPWHLDPVPASINTSRYHANDNTITKKRDWNSGCCKNGHSLAICGYIDRKKKDGRVSRECRDCRKEQNMRYYRTR